MASALVRKPVSDLEVDRTVVLIGRTGSGKSTCANTLAGYGEDKDKDKMFGESCSSISETKELESRTVVVSWRGKEYTLKIVDTIGIGDTNL